MTDTWTFSLVFPAKPEYIVLGRLAVAGLARSVALDEEAIGDLKLAITEACTNAIQHAYTPDTAGAVTVTWEVEPDVVRVAVSDDGRGLTGEPRNTLGDREGGMGLAIIRSIADDVEIVNGAGDRGTLVRFTKRIPTA